MPDKRLAGLMLLSAGAACILASFSPYLNSDSGLSVLAGFSLMTLGSAILAAHGQRLDIFAGLPAFLLRRNMAGGSAKRLKIRIRCAR